MNSMYRLRLCTQKDDKKCAFLFRDVWMSSSMGTVGASLFSPGGFCLCFFISYLIDCAFLKNYTNHNAYIFVMLRMCTPIFALVPVCSFLAYRSHAAQKKYVTSSMQSGMNRISSQCSPNEGKLLKLCWVCENESNGKIIGCIVLNESEIQVLVVDSVFRRQGKRDT